MKTGDMGVDTEGVFQYGLGNKEAAKWKRGKVTAVCDGLDHKMEFYGATTATDVMPRPPIKIKDAKFTDMFCKCGSALLWMTESKYKQNKNCIPDQLKKEQEEEEDELF